MHQDERRGIDDGVSDDRRKLQNDFRRGNRRARGSRRRTGAKRQRGESGKRRRLRRSQGGEIAGVGKGNVASNGRTVHLKIVRRTRPRRVASDRARKNDDELLTCEWREGERRGPALSVQYPCSVRSVGA